jgi:hypothetical protein
MPVDRARPVHFPHGIVAGFRLGVYNGEVSATAWTGSGPTNRWPNTAAIAAIRPISTGSTP